MKAKSACLLLLAFLSTSAFAGPLEDNLLKAIQTGNRVKAEAAIKAGAKLNRRLEDGSLALAWAVESQNHGMVSLLLEHGAKPNVVSKDTATFSPLIVACERGNPLIVGSLLDAGANVNDRTRTGVSPLALCAGNSSLDTVKKLLALGAEVEAADNRGQTPLMWAATRGKVETVKLLVKHGARVNAKTKAGMTPLLFAIKSGNPDVPKTIFSAGGDVDYITPDGTSAVQLAMYQKQFAFAAQLIQRGVDMDAFDRNGQQLLHAAILDHRPELVKLLLNKGANPNTPTGTSKVVWRYEVNFTSRPYVKYPRSPLLLAAAASDVDMMQALVAAGADPGYRAEDGTNVLLAASQSNYQTMALALKLAPDVNVTNKSGKTPLHVLMGYSSDPNLTNTEMTKMFKLLADHGARIDVADKQGKTPADLAQAKQFRARAEFTAIFKSKRYKL